FGTGGGDLHRPLQGLEIGDALGVEHDDLAVKNGVGGVEGPNGRGENLELRGPVFLVACKEAGLAAIEPRLDAVSVELRFMDPALFGGGMINQRGKLRFDEARQAGLATARKR